MNPRFEIVDDEGKKEGVLKALEAMDFGEKEREGGVGSSEDGAADEKVSKDGATEEDPSVTRKLTEDQAEVAGVLVSKSDLEAAGLYQIASGEV